MYRRSIIKYQNRKTCDVNIDKLNGKQKTYKGKITWISSESEFTPKMIQTKNERVNLVYAVKIRVDNDGDIKIGMPGDGFQLVLKLIYANR